MIYLKINKTEDGIDTYHSSKYNQTYHSIHGVLQEAEHVFLNGSGVLEKIQSAQPIKILEIGFGTGFNFFLTAQKTMQLGASIEYHSFENDLLSYQQFIRLNHNNFGLAQQVRDTFIQWREKNGNLNKEEYVFEFNKNIKLNLMLCNAQEANLPQDYFDAVYQDAFSPVENPELWTPGFFSMIFCSMKKGAKLSTYSAKGQVSKSMIEAGFDVEKHIGPKGKREMLVAVKDE